MSVISAIGAILVIAFLNVLPSTVPVQLNGEVHLAYFLLTLIVGVVFYLNTQ
ncbi:hypothetical protein [Halorubrum halophilum]|uniref:hypothetical protein n=1 Tax=Halorubrum halophilum TaxID=413816 RepID=UPI0012ABD03C|nr:hypothetical protein [Halorubrum halophilum]